MHCPFEWNPIQLALPRRFSVSDGAKLHLAKSRRATSMAESPLLLADRAARVFRPGDGAVELLGRSAAIVRVHEMIRRGAALDGGALITAEAGAETEAVARELHQRGRAPASPYVAVHCDAADPASVDRLLFGNPAPGPATDLESVAADSRIAAACGGVL